MRKTALLAAFVVACFALPAHAQRVFVSGSGSDSNPCTFAAPCRSFQQAFNIAPANGEIDALDPAGYGSLTINKPISIQGHGFAAITAASGANGIYINFTGTSYSYNAVVNLNGLLIDGAGVGNDGILVQTAEAVTITNCEVRNFAHNGIDDIDTQYFTVTNTIASDNGANGGTQYQGVYIHSDGVAATMATLTGVIATYNGNNGIVAQGSSTLVTIFSANASNNSNDGILAENGATVTVRDSVAANNGNGFESTSSAVLGLAHSVASMNSNGINVNGGSVWSYQDNNVFENGTAVVGTPNTITTQ